MTRKECIANGLMDFADHGGWSVTVEQMQAADEIRSRFSADEVLIGSNAVHALAEHEGPGWLWDSRWARLNREAASLLMSNRRVP